MQILLTYTLKNTACFDVQNMTNKQSPPLTEFTILYSFGGVGRGVPSFTRCRRSSGGGVTLSVFAALINQPKRRVGFGRF